MILAHLEPNAVWRHFEAMCQIPHTSKNEARIAEYVVSIAQKAKLPVKRDDVGNVLVSKPATPGKENVPVMVLQGHLDMVGVRATGSAHNFDTDPIRVKIEGDYVRAIETTLGADNGIGGAMMLALMEAKDIAHGPLEFFFTIDEEAGMTGAHNVKPDFISGKRLINLDTEEWGAYYISCAGGGDSVIRLPINRSTAIDGGIFMAVDITGLKGGHSGADINLGHGSANRIMGRLLYAARENASFRIADIKGGSKRNAIAAEAHATVWMATQLQGGFIHALEARAAEIKAELEKTDPGFTVTVKPIASVELSPMSAQCTQKIIDLLVGLPHGVLAMSPEVPGLVETSTNIGVIGATDKLFTVSMLTRSAVDTMIGAVKQQIKTVATLVGAEVEEPLGYPGWKPNMDSYLLKRATEVYRDLYKTDPQVRAIHAGLECGIFSKRFIGIDMLSLGPEIHGAHSPAEEVLIPTVKQTWELLVAILNALD